MGAALQEQWLTKWAVTADKVAEAVARIIAAGNPERILAYGSRARGDFSNDSDLDLAVILDRIDPNEPVPVRSSVFRGIPLDIDLLVTDRIQHDRFKGARGSVHFDIEKDGIVIYDRSRDAGANPDALEKIGVR
ncbi:MAG: nucleotidyltransferase domain-containing protein [Acidobacteriaceae bacterium]